MTVPPGYEIRPAAGGDLPALADIERQADARFCDLLENTGLTMASLTRVTSAERLEEGRRTGRLWVATSPAGAIVGFALVLEVAGLAHLDEIAVLPSHGRLGLGSALLEAVCSWAERSRYPAVTLSTFRDVPWNAPFYASRGFRAVAPSQLGQEYVELVAAEQRGGLRTDLRVIMARRTAGDVQQ